MASVFVCIHGGLHGTGVVAMVTEKGFSEFSFTLTVFPQLVHSQGVLTATAITTLSTRENAPSPFSIFPS